MKTTVSLKVDNEIGYLTFATDPPGKPPTLDHAVLDELAAKLDEVEASDLRALVVQSQAEKYFVVGANIRALQTLHAETMVAWIRHGHDVFNRLESLPIPVIARVSGYALGGGLELAMACDLIVATPAAQFGQPEAKLGFVAGWGGTARLPRRVGRAKAKDLFFTGKIIDAATALQIGLVNYVGEPSELDQYLVTTLHDICACSPLALAWMKQLVDASADASIDDGFMREAVASTECIASEDTQTRVADFLEGRKR